MNNYSIVFSENSKKTTVSIDIIKSFDKNLSLSKYDSKDINTLSELKKFPTVESLPFVKNQRGELDLTMFKSYIKKEQTNFKLIKGNNIQKFFLKDLEDALYISDEFITKTKKSIYINKKRIACPQISNQKSAVRIKFSLVNENLILGNSCNFISVEDNIFGYNIALDPLVAAILTFVINYSAYLIEIIRSGLESIDSGQHEAAKVLGYSYWQKIRYVVLPQGIRRVLPTLGNEAITLVKDTALIYVLAITEIMKRTKELASTYYNITPYICAIIIYLALSLIIDRIFKYMEAKNKVRV